MKSIRFAVIGTAHGHIMEFINDMLDIGGEFVGVYNDGSDLCKHISEKYSVSIYEEIKALLRNSVRVVGTAAINCDKIDVIEQCAEKGVHVIADKPIVVNEQQYERLKKVIKTSEIEIGLLLSVRFIPEVYTIKQLIDAGEIGELLNVEILNPHQLKASTRPDWHFEKAQNGGIVIDLMPHSIDLFRWLTGSEIADYKGSVKKSILKEKPDFFDISEFYVNSENNISGYFRVDWHMTDSHWSWGDLRIFCTGTKGCLEVRATGDPITKESVIVLYRDIHETAKYPAVKCDTSATKDFVNRINGEKFIIGHHDILESVRMSLEFDKSARGNRN